MRSAVFIFLVVAALVVPPAASARSLRVDVPRSITAGIPFSATWAGETGPQDASTFGGFVVDTYLRSGAGRCPATRSGSADRRRVATLGAQNVLIASSFRGANQLVVPRPGRYRLCGYLSKPGGGSLAYERLVDRGSIRVKSRSARAKPRAVPRPRAGVYVGSVARIAGGGPAASISITVSGNTVEQVVASDVRLSRCDVEAFPTQPLLNTLINVESTAPARGLGSELNRPTVALSLPGALPEGSIQLNGGFSSSREIRGVLTAADPSGVCSGAFAFTARR